MPFQIIAVLALFAAFIVGWVVGALGAKARAWRESVEQSQSYQSIIDELRMQLADRINMTADEFFDHWSQWCSMYVSVKDADLLTTVFASIMKTFEARGSPTHQRQVLDRIKGPVLSSPDIRKEHQREIDKVHQEVDDAKHPLHVTTEWEDRLQTITYMYGPTARRAAAKFGDRLLEAAQAYTLDGSHDNWYEIQQLIGVLRHELRSKTGVTNE